MLPHAPAWARAIVKQIGTRSTPPETPSGRDADQVPQPDAVRLAALTSPATVAALLPLPKTGPPLPAPLDQASVTTARTLNRFRRRLGESWVSKIHAAGFDIMVMKGCASAHLLYQSADDRGLSDVDVLIRPTDLTPVCRYLRGQGCTFADMPTRSPWGFVSDASFQPLITPDGAGNIDLHIHPDAWPLHLVLTSADMLAAAREHADGLYLPHPDHHFLIMASHAARDLFGPNAMKGIVDGLVMLAGPGPKPDLNRIRTIAAQAGLGVAVDSFITILTALGAPQLPGMPTPRPPGTVLMRTITMIADLFPDGTDLTTMEKLKREFTIAAGPRIALARMGKRTAGLVRRSPGLPKMD